MREFGVTILVSAAILGIAYVLSRARRRRAPEIPGPAAVPAPESAFGDPGGFGDSLDHGIVPGTLQEIEQADFWLERGADGAVAGHRAPSCGDVAAAQREVYALYEIARTLGSPSRIPEVLDRVLLKIGQIIPYRTGVFYLREPGKDTLAARAVCGADAEALRGHVLKKGEGITGGAAARRSNAFSGTPGLDLGGTALDPTACSSVAAFPICLDGEVLGAITLYFPKDVPCLDDHVRLLDIIARLSAGAVADGVAGGESWEPSLTDELTYLPTSRYLRQVFEREKIRSQQAGQPLSLLEMDLDDFRTVNDRFGQHVGDRYLAEVSRVMRSHLREVDVLARLGGDEFAAVLPLTGFAQAALLAERLQRAVGIFSLRLEEGKVARAGLSVGIAIFPQDSESFEELLVRADYNMYQNKSARKNARVERGPNVLPFPITSPGSSG
jgi:diguanylate cyclase (GGDEF)-like protein